MRSRLAMLAVGGRKWLCLLTLILGIAESIYPDSHVPTTLSKLAFGSCSKVDRAQKLWPAVKAFKPQSWLWVGDAVYYNKSGLVTERHVPKGVREMLTMQHRREDYRAATEGAVIEGVYDDHDYGENDAGKHFRDRAASQEDVNQEL